MFIFKFLGVVILLMVIIILGMIITVLGQAIYNEFKDGRRRRY